MKPDCRNFRARLAVALRGPLPVAREPAFGGLGWHRHVIDCAACRELLSEEEALDELLRSLPQPHLPRALAERVLSRLENARRGVELDRLLDLPSPEPAPADLARNVLTRVHAEQGLDRLLESVPAERVPAGLERRILARLELARRVKVARTRKQPASARRLASVAPVRSERAASFQLPLRIAAGIALASLAGWGLWSLRRSLVEPSTPAQPEFATGTLPADSTPKQLPIPVGSNNVAVTPNSIAQPDEQLLASLDVFEAWDLLASADGLDASLSTLDPLDEYLLDFESAAPTTESTPAAETPAVPDTDSPNTKKNG